MITIKIIGSGILFFISVGLFIIAYNQFKEKGFLFNNAYIYASKEEREKMNKKPYYRQSAIAFVILGIIFLLNAINIIILSNWLFFAVIGLVIFLVTYAIISSIIIERKSR